MEWNVYYKYFVPQYQDTDQQHHQDAYWDLEKGKFKKKDKSDDQYYVATAFFS